MKLNTRFLIPRPASFIPLLVTLAALILLSLRTDNTTYAQTDPPPVLDAPVLTAQAGEGKIGLQWQAVTGAARYELLAWTEASGWYQLDVGTLTDTSYQHTDATPGTEYFYAVRAIAADGSVGEWSNFPSASLPATQHQTQFALRSLADTSAADPTATPTADSTAAPTATPTVTPTPGSPERAALVALYNATGGANWRRSTNWLSDEPLDTWRGVLTDSNGRVIILGLRKKGLKGQLPSLSGLTALEHLSLNSNQLSGPIPDLSSLTNLQTLSLGNNKLTGSIPDLTTLTKLYLLLLYNNKLTGPFPNLSTLTELDHLMLSNNQLSGTIPDLSALTKLRYLSLASNRLTGSFPDLSALTNLRSVSLQLNQFTESIPALNSLTELHTLYASFNQLSGPIPDLSALTKLTILSLQYNQLTGPVPDMVAQPNLRHLSLRNNQLTGSIPTSLENHSSLYILYLSNNQLSGCIPASLSSVEYNDLDGLDLSYCATVTPIPTAIPG